MDEEEVEREDEAAINDGNRRAYLEFFDRVGVAAADYTWALLLKSALGVPTV